MSKPCVGVAVVALDEVKTEFMRVFIPFVNSELVEDFALVQGCLLPAARNNVLKLLLKPGHPYTHVLMIDSDMTRYKAHHLQAMLAREEDCVSGVCVMKEPPYRIAATFKDELLVEQLKKEHALDRELVEVEAVGTAFMLVTVKLLNAIKEETTDGLQWFNTDRQHRPTILEEANELVQLYLMKEKGLSPEEREQALMELIEFGTTAHHGSCLMGEDINFCTRAKIAGYRVYLDPNILIGHVTTAVKSLANNPHVWQNKGEMKPIGPVPLL